MTGQFYRSGMKWQTTYDETGDALYDLIDDYYMGAYNQFMKAEGAAVYGDNGYFNAIMGRDISLAMFSSDNAYAMIGARAYQHEGVRISKALATYGINAAGKFVGIGGGTVQDGAIPESVKLPVNEYRQPYKEVPFSYDYGLGLRALEGKDDTTAYRDYVNVMATNYSDYIDRTILQPLNSIETGMPVTDGVETSLNPISRIISGFSEIGMVENGTTITPEMVSPYGGMGSSKGDFYAERTAKKSNLDAHVNDAKGGQLTLMDLKRLYRVCSVNWKNSSSPNNKIWLMGNIAQDKIAALMMASNYYKESVYIQRDFNGVKTIPGRDVGFLVNSFQNVPIIQDGNINFDYDILQPSAVRMGDIYLCDLDHMWMSTLTPVDTFSCDNPAITRKLQEVNVMNMRCELRCDRFIGSGKIVNLGDDIGA